MDLTLPTEIRERNNLKGKIESCYNTINKTIDFYISWSHRFNTVKRTTELVRLSQRIDSEIQAELEIIKKINPALLNLIKFNYREYREKVNDTLVIITKFCHSTYDDYKKYPDLDESFTKTIDFLESALPSLRDLMERLDSNPVSNDDPPWIRKENDKKLWGNWKNKVDDSVCYGDNVIADYNRLYARITRRPPAGIVYEYKIKKIGATDLKLINIDHLE